MSLNKMLVIGNLGTDPEMQYTPSGVPVTRFRLAASRRYTNQNGEQIDDTEWFTITAWRRLAEQTNQYLVKGKKVYVEGRLESRTWQGQDGQNRFENRIQADRVVFLDPAGQTSGEPGGYTGGGGGGSPFGSPPADDDADDLPW